MNKLTDYNILWSYEARKVRVTERGWRDTFFEQDLISRGIHDTHSSGCCYLNWKKKELENVYRLFVSLIREGFETKDTYEQFLKIKKFSSNEAIDILDVISCP